MNSTLLWLVGILFFLASGTAAAGYYADAALNNITYEFSRLKLSQGQLWLYISISNANNFNIPIDNLRGTVYYQGQPMAYFNTTTPTPIPAISEGFEIPIQLRIQYGNIGANLMEFLSNAAAAVVSVDSELTLKGITLPYSQDIKIIELI